MQVLQGIATKYSNLFNAEGSYSVFHSKWGWIATVNDMANNDRTKWDFFFEMNVIEFFNTVAFYKDRGDQEKAEIENMKR